MEQMLTEAVRQVPSLVVLVLLVVQFLRALDRRDQTIRAIADTCHAAQAQASRVIEDNSRALGRVTECLDAQRQSIADAVRDGIDRSALAKP